MKNILLVGAVSIGIFSANMSQAVGVNNYFIGITPTLFLYKNIQAEGSTPSERVTYPVTVTFEYSIDRLNRLKINFRGIDAQFQAGKSGLGITTTGYQLTYSWSRKIRLSRSFKPWLGAGLVSGFYDETNRHKTDTDGFISQSLDDKKVTVFSFSLNASAEWELSRSWFVDVTTQYEIPVSGGLQGFGVGTGVKYRFK